MGQFFSLSFLDGLEQPWQLIAKILVYGLIGGFIFAVKFVFASIPEGSVALRRRFGKIVMKQGEPLVLTSGRRLNLWGVYTLEIVDTRQIPLEISGLAVQRGDYDVLYITATIVLQVSADDKWGVYWYVMRSQNRDLQVRSFIEAALITWINSGTPLNNSFGVALSSLHDEFGLSVVGVYPGGTRPDAELMKAAALREIARMSPHGADPATSAAIADS